MTKQDLRELINTEIDKLASDSTEKSIGSATQRISDLIWQYYDSNQIETKPIKNVIPF